MLIKYLINKDSFKVYRINVENDIIVDIESIKHEFTFKDKLLIERWSREGMSYMPWIEIEDINKRPFSFITYKGFVLNSSLNKVKLLEHIREARR